MTNLVEIKYGSSGKFPGVFINGEAISRYMSLSDYIYDDIFRWADQLFDIMDSELAEPYTISLTGHPYHEVVLNSAKVKSEFCEGIEFKNIEYRIPVREKYDFACSLNETYNIIDTKKRVIAFTCKAPEKFEALNLSNAVFTTDASDYGIAFEEDGVTDTKFAVCISDTNRIAKQKGSVTIYVTRESLPLLIDYLNTYHICISTIEDIFTKLSSAPLSAAAKLEFEAYSKEEYRILVKEIPPHLEWGESFEISYEHFPKCFNDPGIKVYSDNTSVISCEGKTLTARDKGVCEIRVCDSVGNEYASGKIEVSRHNYATNITVVLPTTSMNVGDTLKFRCITTPNDAEDAEDITYSVNNEKVAVISGKNELYALSSGRVCVTVSTPRISRNFYVSVLSQANGIAVSAEEIEVPCSAEATIYCAPVPADASPAPTISWSTSSNIIKIMKSDSSKCTVMTLNSGEAELVCKIDGTDIEKRIKITVPKVKGCYVATAVYGSYDCPEVWVLRRFRDNYLDRHFLGKLFIKAYYAVSPTVVRLFGRQEWFHKFWRGHLDRMVTSLLKKGYEDTPYGDR